MCQLNSDFPDSAFKENERDQHLFSCLQKFKKSFKIYASAICQALCAGSRCWTRPKGPLLRGMELKMWESLKLASASYFPKCFPIIFWGNSSTVRPYYAFYLNALRNIAEKTLVNHVNAFIKLFTMNPLLVESLTTSHRIDLRKSRIQRPWFISYVIIQLPPNVNNANILVNGHIIYH